MSAVHRLERLKAGGGLWHLPIGKEEIWDESVLIFPLLSIAFRVLLKRSTNLSVRGWYRVVWIGLMSSRR